MIPTAPKKTVSLQSRRHAQATVGVAVGLLIAAIGARASDTRLNADALFQASRVIEVKIDLPAADWRELTGQTRDFGRAVQDPSQQPFTEFKAELVIDGVKVGPVTVRKKGFIGSLDDYRPSLKIAFDKAVEPGPIDGLDRLTLNNNKQDHSLVSQYLTYRTFRKAGIHAPRVGFARVTVNGESLGVYSNVESVRVPFLAAAFGDGSGDLYEGTLSDLYPKAIDRVEVKRGEAGARGLLPLAELLAAGGDLDLARVNELVDVPYFLKFLAVESLIGFWDGYGNNQNNYFIYRHPRGGKFQFIPWGADGAFDGGRGMMRAMANLDTTAIYANGMLANRLFWAGNTVDQYSNAMAEILENCWDEEELLAEVKRIESLLAPAVHPLQADFRDSLGQVKQFIRTRRDQINRIIASGWDNVPRAPRKPMYSVTLGAAEGTFATSWSENPGSADGEQGRLELRLRLNGKPVELASASATAGPMSVRGFGFGGGGGRGPGGQPRPMMSVQLSGVRKVDNQPLTLTLMIDQEQFERAVDGEIDIGGFLQESAAGFGFGGRGGGMRTVSGTLKLDAAGTTAGETVSGAFNLEISETRGGMFSRW